MFFNVLIRLDENETFNTDCFYYNAKEHYLRYHSPYRDKPSVWTTVSNVECQIKVDRPMIHVTATTIKE